MKLPLFSEVLTSKDKKEFDINQDDCLLDFYHFAFYFSVCGRWQRITVVGFLVVIWIVA